VIFYIIIIINVGLRYFAMISSSQCLKMCFSKKLKKYEKCLKMCLHGKYLAFLEDKTGLCRTLCDKYWSL